MCGKINHLNAISALMMVLICCNFSLYAAQKVSMDNICRLLSTGDLITNTADCKAYYRCVNGRAFPEKCETNLYFNKEYQACVIASAAPCITGEEKPCENHAVGTWAADPASCNGYYYCSAKGPEKAFCPTGQNFNPGYQRCDWHSVYPCFDDTETPNGNPNAPIAPVNLCRYIRNGRYFASAVDCSGYSICRENVVEGGLCDPEEYTDDPRDKFNVENRLCDYNSQVTCTQVSNDPALIGNPKVGRCKPEETGTAKVAGGSCANYYKCDGEFWRLTICRAGTYFDDVYKLCTDRMHARNNCDRCVGTKAKFVNAYSDVDCSTYLRCDNGVKHGSVGRCGPGEYFNELAGGICINGPQPFYGCCNPKIFP